MRIATWNLERPSPRSWKRLPRQRQRMASVDADVWVLTETRASISPSEGFHGLHAPAHPDRRPDPDERWTSIWSRWPLSPSPVPANPRGTVSAVVHAPDGPMVVYGTVIPWANEKGDDGRARMWEVHYAEIERQAGEWEQLQDAYPSSPLIVAGDFNQSRDGSSWYGRSKGRELLSSALWSCGIDCVTEADMVETGQLADAHLVDHIAVSRWWLDGRDAEVTCIEKHDDEGVRLSDHPTVIVDVQ